MSAITLTEQSAASTPSSATVVMYPKSDGLMYSKDDAGTETLLSGLTAATQAEMETATSVAVTTTPGRQQFHPGHPKGWVQANASGVATTSYNVTSVTDSGTGDVLVTWATDFATGNYCVTSAARTDSALFLTIGETNTVAGATRCRTFDQAGAPTDPNYSMVSAFGDQA